MPCGGRELDHGAGSGSVRRRMQRARSRRRRPGMASRRRRARRCTGAVVKKRTGPSENARRLDAILDTAVDAIVTIEESGVIESINPATERMFGYAHDELVGNNVSTLMPLPHREEHDRYIANYLRTGEAHIIGIGREVEARRKDGTVFPVDLAVSEVRLPGRRLFTAIIRDLTERRALEAQAALDLDDAAHTARLLELGEMCSGIVHEVAQPLTAIVSYSEACLRTVRGGRAEPALIEDALGRVAEQGVRAAEIVSRLRHLVRKGGSRRETFDLGMTIEQALLLVEHERRRRGVLIEVHHESELPPVSADRVQVEQILLNLLRNAFQAVDGADCRRVWMTTGRAGTRRLRLTVEDSGPGLAPELCDRVFETFYTTKPNGLGVGLAISRSLAEEHGGRLWAESSEGRGARFNLELPHPAPEAR